MAKFVFPEAGIEEVHRAIEAGELTVRELVDWYLARIEKFDQQGPALNAVILVNPKVRAEAAALDEYYREHGFKGPLHGIAVLLKDNVDTADMITTAGSLALRDFQPAADAHIVKLLKEAGAIILAKTNLHEFAVWGETTSSLGGQTLNPYDLRRTPGGSSGGTGAAVAANYGIIGIGTDTINSVRSPASANSIVGIRPTLGLVSRNGIIPYSLTQDTAGPICRTVTDAARTLEVIAGFDPDDCSTAWAYGRKEQYSSYLYKDGLQGRKIGVLRSFFGQDAIHQEVNRVMEEAIESIKQAGAEVFDITEEIDSGALVNDISVHLYDLKEHLNQYLQAQGSRIKYHSLQAIIDSGEYSSSIEENIKQAQSLSTGTAEYKQRLIKRAELQKMILELMARMDVDALVYPHQKRLVVPVGEIQAERNGALGSVTGFPSIVVPAGFTAPNREAAIGVPVGLEIFGRPWDEGRLIAIAYSFEQHTKARRLPLSTPFA
ncbi:MAG TPA: amidase [Candidatus Avacidaminococcus intestinavium]|uniref:Amidase n=1 Tax=Candidatus Avacidaminococcus intestinavium TaxID=2840684 RepID=A0A9D1SL49_9FIRM|nr:amidase [Candidatus Avacidaminococcus intestinavium]